MNTPGCYNGHLLVADLDAILDRGESLFRRMAGERLFVTGGTGFFGRWLLEALTHADDRLRLGLRITVLSRSPEAFAARAPALSQYAALDWWRGDVRDFALPPGGYPLIIHAATAASEQLNRARPLKMFDTIVAGTRRVLELADQAGTCAMLLTSSGAVYGRQPSELTHVSEDYGGAPCPHSADSAYGEGKRAAEFLAAASSLPVKIARGFAFVGAFQPLDAHFAAGNFIGDALSAGPIVVRGDGTALRSYLYAGDLVIWLLKILLDAPPARPYNVGSDQAISIGSLAARVADIAGGVPVKRRCEPDGNPPARYVPDIQRARNELGLDMWTDLDTALERTFRFAQQTCATRSRHVSVRQ
ncbi:MAG: NAD(P)-dependent oxidoreductase [Candidatus Accumulibacter phosphatis]|uniref:UDP-glucose 4-epimerase n=2 Tax=Candidatus Accumulibacter TaxID=327159 RepID=A0A080M008_9PROT|nr:MULTISPECIES: NAD(P)-dependent oxidoreductase [Candidatus Accumulibacter]KFB74461.1 MAG: UDP-glucose 4-epimerase [Candidatus Accumulibacter phosphatis]HRF06775.1 NAD(P)-dependent oxidoreductase [Accumulibacter sp.]